MQPGRAGSRQGQLPEGKKAFKEGPIVPDVKGPHKASKKAKREQPQNLNNLIASKELLGRNKDPVQRSGQGAKSIFTIDGPRVRG